MSPCYFSILSYFINFLLFIRWALSTVGLSRLRQRAVLQDQPTVALLQADAAECRNFDVAGGWDVVVIAWDRGIARSQYHDIVRAVQASGNVKGILLRCIVCLL